MTSAQYGNGLSLILKPSQVEASLWRRFRFDDDFTCREKIFNQYHIMAIKAARKQFRIRPSYGLERADFEQFAFAGLLEAIDNYDPLRSIPFSAFAKFRIHGSISSGLSNSNEAASSYSHQRRAELDRLKSLEQGADEQDSLTLVSNLAVGLALGYMLEDVGLAVSNDAKDYGPNAYESLSWRELKLKLSQEIDNLPRKQKSVVKQHYMNGVAFVQIAQLLNLSKGRISQLHKLAIGHLRRSIGKFY